MRLMVTSSATLACTALLGAPLLARVHSPVAKAKKQPLV
jgi:hypothetical protein